MNTAYPHIIRTEGTCGGRPRIENSRIEVRHIAAYLQLGNSPEDIAAMFPHIAPVQLYAALAYYFDNTDEIEGYMEDERRVYEEGRRAQLSEQTMSIAV